MYIEGSISKDELNILKEEFENLGWIITKECKDNLEYLDKKMNKHKLTIGEKTEYIIIGG